MKAINKGIIILAAGASARMGRAKQLLLFQNKTLLQHAIDEATLSAAGSIAVVLGARSEIISTQIRTESVMLVFNQQWQAGMAGSVQAGLNALLKHSPDIDSIIIMLCDQPYVSSLLLNDMIQAQASSGKGIVACMYQNTTGVPVLFTQPYFEQLLALEGEEGAKKILHANSSDVAALPFAPGATDIDTIADYEQLLKDSQS